MTAPSASWSSPPAYDQLPAERQPVVLALCYLVDDQTFHVYTRCGFRTVKFLVFFDQQVSRSIAVGKFMDQYNLVTTVNPGAAVPYPEEYFKDEAKIDFFDIIGLDGLAKLTSQSSGAGGLHGGGGTTYPAPVGAASLGRILPVDPKRMAMFGGSHGGHVTGRMVSRVKLSCAVLCAPAGLDMVALSQLAEKGTPVGGNQRLIREMEQRSGVKMTDIGKNPGAYHYSSPLTEAAQVKCPILLISGRNDNNAPLPVMDGYVDKLRAVGKIAETYHPDNGPHGFYVGLP